MQKTTESITFGKKSTVRRIFLENACSGKSETRLQAHLSKIAPNINTTTMIDAIIVGVSSFGPQFNADINK